jgi:hypothetical protein
MEDPVLAFLDSQAVESETFDPASSANLKALANLVRGGSVRLLTTDLTNREIRRRIDKRLGSAMKQWDKLVKVAIRGGAPTELSEATAARIGSHLWARWEAFLTELKVEVISTAGVQLPTVLDLYFGVKPPFSESKPKEFPDAIALLALAAHADAIQRTIHVISGDGDMKMAARLSTHLEGGLELGDLLDRVNSRNALAQEFRSALLSEQNAAFQANVRERLQDALAAQPDLFQPDHGHSFIRDVRLIGTRFDAVRIIELFPGAQKGFLLWEGTASVRLRHSRDDVTFADLIKRVPVSVEVIATRDGTGTPEFKVHYVKVSGPTAIP